MLTRDLTVKKIHDGLRAKTFSAQEVTHAYIKQIDAHDKNIGAFLEVWKTRATGEAAEVDKKLAQGIQLPTLAGIPIALKDNMLVTGEHASAGSKMLEHYVASYDGGVVKKLKHEHAVLLGRTNCDEFAMGSSTENSAYQKTKNPHDLTRVPGGSSGGSAAAVAADFAPIALGSDTGGSIRQPAGFCGVVGLKPTYGAVSRSGLIAMSSSLDQIGPFTKTVEDAALVFNSIAGKDPYDNTSVDTTYGDELFNPNFEKLKQMTVGIPDEYFATPDMPDGSRGGRVDGIEPEVRKGIESVIETYKSLGVKFKKISLPHTKYALSCYYIIQPAEVSSNLARFDGIRYGSDKSHVTSHKSLKDIYYETRGKGFGPEPKRRIILGTFVLSSGYYDAYYKKALEVKEYMADDFESAFKEVDVMLTPVAPTRAFKFGDKVNDPLAMYLCDIFTIPANLVGLPAISIPVRLAKGALPIGFQLMGKHWREQDILGLGMLYERQ